MEASTVGKVTVAAKIENIEDLYEVDRGNLTPEQVRCVEVAEALVDTGATMLSLPANMIDLFCGATLTESQFGSAIGP